MQQYPQPPQQQPPQQQPPQQQPPQQQYPQQQYPQQPYPQQPYPPHGYPQQFRPRTSGAAVTSLVLGILSIVCFSILTGIPSIIFGLVGLSAIKKHPQAITGRGFAIAGITLSLFSIVILAGFIAYGYTQRPKPFAVAAPEYTTLIGEDYYGRGFHFDHNGRTYIGCSLHQFDNAQPAIMLSEQFNDPVEITAQAHLQEDVQILSYKSRDLDRIPALPYTPSPRIRVGDPIYMMDGDTPIKGHVKRQNPFDNQWIFEPENGTTFAAQARSGSPVISGLNGEVIGVLLTADDADHATWGGFEPITLP